MFEGIEYTCITYPPDGLSDSLLYVTVVFFADKRRSCLTTHPPLPDKDIKQKCLYIIRYHVHNK